MSSAEGTAVAQTRYAFEFRGTGGEYFRIWIVNLALTIITLGIFGAWAKVRTRRYFNGNTYLAGHAFDYHASGLRILIGRAIAFAILIAYQASVLLFHAWGSAIWGILFLFMFPWLINASLRFNARNTSYRNVRFNFTATDGDAFMAYIVWPFLGIITLGLLWPLAQRAKDYFYINHHTYGRRYFETKFTAWDIYSIFLLALGLSVAIGIVEVVLVVKGASVLHISGIGPMLEAPGGQLSIWHFLIVGAMVVFYIPFLFVAPIIHAMIVNLSIRNTVFDEKHELWSDMSPVKVAWIMISNVILTVITLGIYYPWAKVRLARYQIDNLKLIATGDIDAYVSEVFDAQSAVGEELGSAFSFDFGL